MRRWLSLLLLFVVPLLSSWSAVAAYCEHAPDAPVRHFGHHPHQHADHTGDNAAGTASDCDHCHSPGATFVFSDGAVDRIEQGRPAPHAEVPLPRRSPAPPDRPKWVGLA